MKTIHQKFIDLRQEKVAAILKVEDWFRSYGDRIHPMYNNYFVVATWYAYGDEIDTKTTIAIVAKQKHALLIYNEL